MDVNCDHKLYIVNRYHTIGIDNKEYRKHWGNVFMSSDPGPAFAFGKDYIDTTRPLFGDGEWIDIEEWVQYKLYRIWTYDWKLKKFIQIVQYNNQGEPYKNTEKE
jgi:hypothetical protein